VKLYVDVDDVLAETTRAIAEHARARFDRDVDFDDMHSFRLDESLGLDALAYEALMESIHRPEFLDLLAPMAGAVETLGALAGRASISVITGRPPAVREVTDAWLRRQGMPFDELCMVDKFGRYPDSGALSLTHLRERRFDFAIEDSLATARYLAEHGCAEVLLMDRPWNRAAPELPSAVRRVHGWIEIEAILLEHTPR
jgi:uncharacterized HAD superfamily protein